MSDRSEKWHATRRARELAEFSGRRYEVVREVKNEEFTTPLGYKGKNGYELREVGTDNVIRVGKATLKRMAEEYSAVDMPAPKKRGRPKKVQGGVIQGPSTKDSDEVLVHLSNRHHETSPYQPAKDTESSEPGAHPVSETEDEDARSGSLAGPTWNNPNADIHYEG